MLERLTINNIALIKSQSLELTKGLNVLTGETGAGKSLIVDALALLLGEKADKNLISRGEKVASVEAVFTKINKNVKDILASFGMDADEEIIITRKLSVDGKNECRVNGESFTLAMLKKLSAPLMDLHGQFEHQNLLKVSSHLKILDLFGGKLVKEKLQEYEKTLKEYEAIIEELNSFNGDDLERNRLIELYKYQIDEIEEAAFYDGEEEELKDFRNQVLHNERILDAVNSAVKMTGGDGYEYQGATEAIKKALVTLSSVSQFCGDLNPLIDRLEASKLELEDISMSLEEMTDKLFIDEDKAKNNENRLDLLSSFKKKYGNSIEAINEYCDRVKAEYDRLVNASDRIEELKKLKEKVEQLLLKNAKSLSEERKNAAKTFEMQVKNELRELGMKNANFVVGFEDLELENRTKQGLDKVEFLFSANLGEEAKPLKAVASGGEMSRFMLAVKNVTAELEGIGTLIFDEIDTGVSGVIAQTLAEKLKKVSKWAQVICVSHLPQIASFGDNHLLIEKFEEEGRTYTVTNKLSGNAREKEIARLISGNITEHSLSHAKELLDYAKNFKC